MVESSPAHLKKRTKSGIVIHYRTKSSIIVWFLILEPFDKWTFLYHSNAYQTFLVKFRCWQCMVYVLKFTVFSKGFKQNALVATYVQSTSLNRTVRFCRIQFLSVCRMVQISNAFENWTNGSVFPMASIDHFGMNKIFFMTLFFIKRSRLV
jgi:hypothetical protein